MRKESSARRRVPVRAMKRDGGNFSVIRKSKEMRNFVNKDKNIFDFLSAFF